MFSLQVNSNGLLSFLTEIPVFFNIQFPLDYPVIAPLYTNVDTRASGAVYYRYLFLIDNLVSDIKGGT
jgi:nidogen (entactin)